MIKENLQEVERRICEACKRSGRDRSEVQLIAVSKTKPVSMIEEAYAEGIRRFGENKPQELRDKYEEMEKDIKWHMIGHLQRNKVKYVVGRAALIHSVDSVRLAEAIDQEAEKKGIVMPVLVEVNVASVWCSCRRMCRFHRKHCQNGAYFCRRTDDDCTFCRKRRG